MTVLKLLMNFLAAQTSDTTVWARARGLRGREYTDLIARDVSNMPLPHLPGDYRRSGNRSRHLPKATSLYNAGAHQDYSRTGILCSARPMSQCHEKEGLARGILKSWVVSRNRCQKPYRCYLSLTHVIGSAGRILRQVNTACRHRALDVACERFADRRKKADES